MSFLEGKPRQECAVEREASWGIAKLRDGGCVIDVDEAAVGQGGGDGDGLPKMFLLRRAVFLVCTYIIF